ncbi:MAG: HEAT repeat domain-containing protein [Alphaproteobacteria bacterium]|nr:HEAT repeat domain-containing protein [Alphaproteobacteria bacterium]
MRWTLLLLSLCVSAPALADVVEDRLTQAANGALPEAERMQAFNRLVMDWATVRPQLEAVARDDDADARERWIAIRVMGQTASRDALPILEDLAKDPMPAIRSAAASAMGDLGFKEASSALVPLLADDAVMVRAAAAVALGQVGDERSADALERSLADTSNYYRGSSLWVRVNYVEALGEIGARSSVPALVACFEDRDPAVRAASLEALRKIVGYDFAEGRTEAEHMEAWRRWAAAQEF